MTEEKRRILAEEDEATLVNRWKYWFARYDIELKQISYMSHVVVVGKGAIKDGTNLILDSFNIPIKRRMGIPNITQVFYNGRVRCVFILSL